MMACITCSMMSRLTPPPWPRREPAHHRACDAGHHGPVALAWRPSPRGEAGRGSARRRGPRPARHRSVSGGKRVSLLELRGVEVAYGDLPALRGVSVSVEPGETLSVVGANGAGKTTMLRAISGLLRPRAGQILLDGVRLDTLPSHAIVEHGLVQVPEGRKIFPSLTVLENLEMGSYVTAARARRREG